MFNYKKSLLVAISVMAYSIIFADNLGSTNQAASGTVTAPTIQTVNKVVAFVNKNVITQNQLNKQMELMRENYADKPVKIPNSNEFKAGVLNQMITLQVELDLAAKLGIDASDVEVLNAVTQIAKTQNQTLDEFKAKLAKTGVSFDEFTAQVRNQIIAEKLKSREVDARISVNDDEVERVLNSEVFKSRIDYNLSYIVINVPEQSTLKEIQTKKKLADDAYLALKNGQAFTDVSVRYSNAPNALQGGGIGWKSNIVLPNVINNALATLKKGDFTPVLQLPMGFLIFKVNDLKTINTPQEVKQYHVRHILIKVGEHDSDDEAHQKIIMVKGILDKYQADSLTESSQFSKLAKEYSADASSMNGGDLGWVSMGDTVPAFELAMLRNPLGQTSQPFKTPFGWHILRVDAVRSKDKTDEVVKASIRREIKEVKAALLYAEWLRNLREAAYIELNDS